MSSDVSEFVVAQGQEMLSELKMQLQHSIDKQIEAVALNYSLDSALTWSASEQEASDFTTQNIDAKGNEYNNL